MARPLLWCAIFSRYQSFQGAKEAEEDELG
jgi:hypothetical protein